MGQTIQDMIREQDNAKRAARGKAADAAAASTINPGGLGELAKAAAARRAAATTMPKVVASPAPKVRPNAQRDTH